jgi:hypothetical protein
VVLHRLFHRVIFVSALLAVGFAPRLGRADVLYSVHERAGYPSVLEGLSTSRPNALSEGEIEFPPRERPSPGAAHMMLKALELSVQPAADEAGSLIFALQKWGGGGAEIREATGETAHRHPFLGAIAACGDSITQSLVSSDELTKDVRRVCVREDQDPSDPLVPFDAAVPEPVSLALVALGLAIMGATGTLRRWARLPSA